MHGDADDLGGQGEGLLFAKGENCWRTARAECFGWVVDGEAYFRVLRESMELAENEIVIVGWDIDSRVELIRDEDHPLYPSPLAATLEKLVERKPGLRVHVLSWDFAMVYMLERELLPAYRFGWRESERLHFQLDGSHPIGASHHQKFVVIDGQLAFIGGLDLTKCRWDTREHASDEPRRVAADGNPYRPFHDVQAVVTGEPASHLRELASSRWNNAAGSPLPESEAGRRGPEALWPDGVPPRARDAVVCLARTWASPEGGEVVREVEQLYLDLIGAARRHVYIENQYFTSPAIADALGRRLADPDGPEVVVVLPGQTSGWLEQATMEALRDRLLGRLAQGDESDRLRVLAPSLAGHDGSDINVHSKLMVIDDRYLRIGSANLSRRSMGLDSECDITLAAESGVAAALVADLLAEHLGADVERIAEVIAERGLIAAIEANDGGDRRLVPLEYEAGDVEPLLEPVAQIADLEKPVETAWGDLVEDKLAGARAVVGEARVGTRRLLQALSSPALGWCFLVLLVAAIIGLVLWQGGGLDGGLDPGALLANVREAASHPSASLAVIPAFVAGSLLLAPVTAMIALCALLFDPWVASVSALAGTLAAAAVNHRIGRSLGTLIEEHVSRGVRERLRSLGRSSDVWSLAGLRLIPIAPFTIINLLAGAFHVSLRDFLLGTLLGMGPGVFLICFSVDRARAALAGEPVFEPWLVGVIAAAGITLIALRVLQQRHGDQ